MTQPVHNQKFAGSPQNARNPRFPARVTGATFAQLAGGEGGIRTLVAGDTR